MNIEPGYIVLCQGKGLLSDLIRKCTGDGPCSHAGMITSVNPDMITEALGHGVVTSKLSNVIAREQHVWVTQPPLRQEQLEAGAAAMLAMVGTPYAWGDLVLQLGDTVLDTNWLTEHWAEASKVYCSMADAISEPWLGLLSKSATPNDIWGLAQVQRWPMEQI